MFRGRYKKMVQINLKKRKYRLISRLFQKYIKHIFFLIKAQAIVFPPFPFHFLLNLSHGQSKNINNFYNKSLFYSRFVKHILN